MFAHLDFLEQGRPDQQNFLRHKSWCPNACCDLKLQARSVKGRVKSRPLAVDPVPHGGDSCNNRNEEDAEEHRVFRSKRRRLPPEQRGGWRLGLPVERLMLPILLEQDHRLQAWTRKPQHVEVLTKPEILS